MEALRQLLGRLLDRLYALIREWILDLAVGVIVRLLRRERFVGKLLNT